ncbi:MAG: PIN domain-containing protein [Burkholderiales bacterium]
MILYLDTSALVKLYVREQGSAQVRAHVNKADVIATSVVAYAEARAAFARLRRERPASGKRHRERVGGDGALAADDFADALGRHADLLGQPILADPHRLQKLFEQHFAGCDGR